MNELLYKSLGLVADPNDNTYPVPAFQHGTSMTKEEQKVIDFAFLPDARGVVSSSAGISIQRGSATLEKFFQDIYRELPPTSGFSDNAKSPELTTLPDGVMTPEKRRLYAENVKEFIRLNTYRPKKESKSKDDEETK